MAVQRQDDRPAVADLPVAELDAGPHLLEHDLLRCTEEPQQAFVRLLSVLGEAEQQGGVALQVGADRRLAEGLGGEDQLAELDSAREQTQRRDADELAVGLVGRDSRDAGQRRHSLARRALLPLVVAELRHLVAVAEAMQASQLVLLVGAGQLRLQREEALLDNGLALLVLAEVCRLETRLQLRDLVLDLLDLRQQTNLRSHVAGREAPVQPRAVEGRQQRVEDGGLVRAGRVEHDQQLVLRVHLVLNLGNDRVDAVGAVQREALDHDHPDRPIQARQVQVVLGLELLQPCGGHDRLEDLVVRRLRDDVLLLQLQASQEGAGVGVRDLELVGLRQGHALLSNPGQVRDHLLLGRIRQAVSVVSLELDVREPVPGGERAEELVARPRRVAFQAGLGHIGERDGALPERARRVLVRLARPQLEHVVDDQPLLFAVERLLLLDAGDDLLLQVLLLGLGEDVVAHAHQPPLAPVVRPLQQLDVDERPALDGALLAAVGRVFAGDDGDAGAGDVVQPDVLAERLVADGRGGLGQVVQVHEAHRLAHLLELRRPLLPDQLFGSAFDLLP